LAKIKNFKNEKDAIAIAKTPGHQNKRKVMELLPFDWSTKVHSKPNLYPFVSPVWETATRLSTLLRRECWVASGLSRWNRCSDPQGSGRGRKSI